jgi:hypothetical protein
MDRILVRLLADAPWLTKILSGETFDEIGPCFMPSVVRSSSSQWQNITEELAFRFGPWVLATWQFPSLSNRSNPLIGQATPEERPTGGKHPVTYQHLRDDGTIRRTLSLDGKVIRYVPFRGKRYFIDLSVGSFNDYLAKFSKKTRGNLKRQVRHFAEYSGGNIDFRYYSAPEEMVEFCEYAIAVSVLGYQKDIPWRFPEVRLEEGLYVLDISATNEFRRNVIAEAQEGRTCGFVLMHDNKAIAYAFCRIDSEIIIYSNIGYDPRFARYSPGAVLLFLILEQLFAARRFRLFDLGEGGWAYKALFATGSVDFVRMIWFPITIPNIGLVLAHYFVTGAWRMGARVKRVARSHSDVVRGWAARRLRCSQ